MKRTTITHEFIVRDVNGAGDVIDAEMVVEYEGNEYKIISAEICGWPAHEHQLWELSQDTDVIDTIQDRLDILNNVAKIGSYAN